MKDNKILLITIGVLICLSQAAFSGEKTFFIKGSNIKSLGAVVSITKMGNFEFKKNGAALTLYSPGTPNAINDFAINSGVVYDAGNSTGRNVQITSAVNDNITVRIWQPNVGNGENYYDTFNLSMNSANYNDSSLTWNWNDKTLNYKAAAPYKPKISTFVESKTTNVDGSSSSSLTVNSAAGSGTDGDRELGDCAWKMWIPANPTNPALDEPREVLAGKTATSLSISSKDLTSGATYAFRVQNKNQWGDSDWSDIIPYTIGKGPAPTSFTFNLKPASETKLIVNCISVSSTSNYTKASELANYINAAAKGNIVTAIYKFDTTNAVPVPALFDTAGAFVSGTDFPLTPGEGIQIYTTQELLNVNL